MTEYLKIKQKISWDEIIPKIEPEVCALLLRDDDNFIIGWGVEDEFLSEKSFDFSEFQKFRDINRSKYSIGYFSYDIKNAIENFLKSENQDLIEAPVSYWFIPKHIITCNNKFLYYFGEWTEDELNEWLKIKVNTQLTEYDPINLQPNTSKKNYISHLNRIKEHIQQGDIYETNYCINFTAKTSDFKAFQTFKKLNKLSTAPFSAYLNFKFAKVLSTSPERFLNKSGNKLTSQPIKGTAPRNSNRSKDALNKSNLESDPKEKSENVMIVDLVRNDLSKISDKNSVHVDELCKIYSFKTVHQMISSISCKLKDDITDQEIIKATFPMGSMTGAPKISAMKIAEKEEDFKRGIYSGAIGVFHPNGNFDLNVVIRSILYNRKSRIVSAAVGGAITIKSDPEKEYEECLTKLKAIREALC